jgi:hypothetical protein
MNPDPASLENLRDIAVPPSVPWWPPAPGWWGVFALLAAVAMLVLLRAFWKWRAAAYRRAAIRELRSATSVVEIAEILKRTALCAYPREDIAALSGRAWCQWLGQTGAVHVPDEVAEALTRGVFGKADGVNVMEVSSFAADWIKHHEKGRGTNR